MSRLYQQDLAFIQATGFGDFAQGAAPEIIRQLRRAPVSIRRVCEMGCGAGPLTTTLVQSGFEVTGIDVSNELLTIARAGCAKARFVHGSLYDLEIPTCEAILAVGEPLTYHDEDGAEDRVRRFFERASEALPSGGLLIFDLIELGEPSLGGKSFKTGEDWVALVDTQEDQDLRVLVRDIETFRKVGELYRRGREVHRVRLFDPVELRGWLDAAGFSVTAAQSYGEFPLAPRRRAFFCVRR